MGLLDSMFGGGTAMNLALDTATSSPGSVVGGRVTLVGGNKPLRLTELKVSLLYVRVESREGQALPSIEAREVSKQVVAAGGDVPPGSQQTFTFRLTVPSDTVPTAHNVSYQVMACADIPGVKDPSAKADLNVIPADDNPNRRIPLDQIVARFPGLHAKDESQIADALHELFLACYSEGAQLMEAEQLVAWHMQNGTQLVRRNALEAWANLVDNRVQPQHLQTLWAFANMQGLDQETFDQVIIAATKFAEEGALPLVQQLAQSPSADIREKVASNLRFNAAEKFQGKRELCVQLAQDASPEVRKAAVGALSAYRDDQQIVYWIANLADSDSSPAVQSACIDALSLVHHHGMGDLALAVYEKHAGNPSAEVRSRVAEQLMWLPEQALQRVWGIVQRLAQDPDESVRRALAFQFVNMQKLPQLLPIAQHMAQSDPSEEVRREVLGAMSSLMQPQQAVAFYMQLLGQARTEEDAWVVLRGARQHREHKDMKRLLTQLGQSHFEGVANAARDELSS